MNYDKKRVNYDKKRVNYDLFFYDIKKYNTLIFYVIIYKIPLYFGIQNELKTFACYTKK